jgi:hypothetical protein
LFFIASVAIVVSSRLLICLSLIIYIPCRID